MEGDDLITKINWWNIQQITWMVKPLNIPISSGSMKKIPCVLGVSAFQIFFFFPAFLPFAALSRCLKLWQSVDEI